MGNWFKRLKEKSGAATVEAIVSFTGFLFVIITILNVANYCRAQMVISNAVDAAAREMGQYSYFYSMSGMKKFNDYVNENAGVGAANINDVIDGVNSVYTTMTTSLSDSSDYGAYLADKVDDQTLNFQDLQTAVMKVDTDANSILSSINAMEAKFSSVQRNPLLYMKSLAAAASGEAFDLAKSYAIAAPLAKVFTAANINSGKLTVQQYLENLGVVNGFDGLNFNTSTIFSASEPNEIHIRCYYKISLCNFVDKSLFDITVCKEAVCRAWLGGDDNPVKVSEQAGVPKPSGGDDSKSNPEVVDNDDDVSGGNGGGGKDGKDDGDVSDGDGGGGGKDPVVADVSGDDTPAGQDVLELVSVLSDPNTTVAEKEAYFKQYVEMYINEAGGADKDEALALYKIALQYGVDIDHINLKGTAGNQWTQNDLDKAIADSITDYPSFKAACNFYTSINGMSMEDKVRKVQEMYSHYPTPGDYMVPAKAEYVTGFDKDGAFVYDWPPDGGFAPGYNAIDPRYYNLPTYWDRYGDLHGTNFSSAEEKKAKYSWDQRGLPYEENPAAYHRGSMNPTAYCDVIEALTKPGGTVDDVNAALKKNGLDPISPKVYEQAQKDYSNYEEYLKNNFYPQPAAPYGIVGTVNPVFESEGQSTSSMADQFVTVFSVDTMIQLGVAKEYKTTP